MSKESEDGTPKIFGVCYAIWCHLYNLKNVKACNFTKCYTPPWVFFAFFKLYKWYQIVQSITFALRRLQTSYRVYSGRINKPINFRFWRSYCDTGRIEIFTKSNIEIFEWRNDTGRFIWKENWNKIQLLL